MSLLYSFLGKEPSPLQDRIRLEDGSTRTDIKNLSKDELHDIGFTGPYVIPEFDKKTQHISWNSQKLNYDIFDIDYQTLLKNFLEELNFMIDYSKVSTEETIFCSEEKIIELQNFYNYLLELKENPPKTREELISFPILKRPLYEKLPQDLMDSVILGISTCKSVLEINNLLINNNINLNYLHSEDADLIFNAGTSILQSN